MVSLSLNQWRVIEAAVKPAFADKHPGDNIVDIDLIGRKVADHGELLVLGVETETNEKQTRLWDVGVQRLRGGALSVVWIVLELDYSELD